MRQLCHSTRYNIGLERCLRGGLAEPEDGGGGVGGAAVAAQQQLPDRVLRARVPAGEREYQGVLVSTSAGTDCE